MKTWRLRHFRWSWRVIPRLYDATMGEVIDFERWSGERARGERRPSRALVNGWLDPAIHRLDRAVSRIDRITSKVQERGGRLAADVETELLALVGQISLGMVDEAASRAERLADVLGGARSSGGG